MCGHVFGVSLERCKFPHEGCKCKDLINVHAKCWLQASEQRKDGQIHGPGSETSETEP